MKPLEPGCLVLQTKLRSAGRVGTAIRFLGGNPPCCVCRRRDRGWLVEFGGVEWDECECILMRIDPDTEIRAERHDEVTA